MGLLDYMAILFLEIFKIINLKGKGERDFQFSDSVPRHADHNTWGEVCSKPEAKTFICASFVSAKNPSNWNIIHCLLRYVGKELDWNNFIWDLNQYGKSTFKAVIQLTMPFYLPLILGFKGISTLFSVVAVLI